MQQFSTWIGGVTGLLVAGGAILARSPEHPSSFAKSSVPQMLENPAKGTGHSRILFAPACSAVYRADGCTQPHHVWKA